MRRRGRGRAPRGPPAHAEHRPGADHPQQDHPDRQPHPRDRAVVGAGRRRRRGGVRPRIGHVAGGPGEGGGRRPLDQGDAPAEEHRGLRAFDDLVGRDLLGVEAPVLQPELTRLGVDHRPVRWRVRVGLVRRRVPVALEVVDPRRAVQVRLGARRPDPEHGLALGSPDHHRLPGRVLEEDAGQAAGDHRDVHAREGGRVEVRAAVKPPLKVT